LPGKKNEGNDPLSLLNSGNPKAPAAVIPVKLPNGLEREPYVTGFVREPYSEIEPLFGKFDLKGDMKPITDEPNDVGA
jgi:hypothetical protein